MQISLVVYTQRTCTLAHSDCFEYSWVIFRMCGRKKIRLIWSTKYMLSGYITIWLCWKTLMLSVYCTSSVCFYVAFISKQLSMLLKTDLNQIMQQILKCFQFIDTETIAEHYLNGHGFNSSNSLLAFCVWLAQRKLPNQMRYNA